MTSPQAQDCSSTPSLVAPDENTTLLRLLTERNRAIRPLPAPSSDNSKSNAWKNGHPLLLKPWDDFTVSTFKTIYTRQLFKACITDIPVGSEVILLDQESSAAGKEDDHRAVYDEWNWKRIDWALNHELIKTRFNPALRRGRGLPVAHQTAWADTPPHDVVRASERCTPRPVTYYGDARQKVTLRPDDGAGRLVDENELELVTMDYKVARKWTSTRMLAKCVDRQGRLKSSVLGTTLVRPIKQLFAYCVAHGCRYGCLLTTEEAFLVRVGPRAEPTDISISSAEFKQEIGTNGLMEYISIPWTNHRDMNEDVHDVEEWTINLALFFILILAGNKHECDWQYGNLKDEELRQHHHTPPPSQPDDAQGDQQVETENAEDITKAAVACQSPESTPRQQSPSSIVTAEIFATKDATPPKPLVRKSTRLKQKATIQQIGVEKGGEKSHVSTGKRRRPDSELQVGPSSTLKKKKKSKPSRDDYLTSFTGSVDGFDDAQQALQANSTEGYDNEREHSLSETPPSGSEST